MSVLSMLLLHITFLSVNDLSHTLTVFLLCCDHIVDYTSCIHFAAEEKKSCVCIINLLLGPEILSQCESKK